MAPDPAADRPVPQVVSGLLTGDPLVALGFDERPDRARSGGTSGPRSVELRELAGSMTTSLNGWFPSRDAVFTRNVSEGEGSIGSACTAGMRAQLAGTSGGLGHSSAEHPREK